jgi:hypothetical protein
VQFIAAFISAENRVSLVGVVIILVEFEEVVDSFVVDIIVVVDVVVAVQLM